MAEIIGYGGTALSCADWFFQSSRSIPGLIGNNPWQPAATWRTYAFTGQALSGTYGYTASKVPAPRSNYGFKIPAFSEDFYYRIHIYPLLTDFGSILQDTSANLEMWNAFFDESTITDYTAINLLGGYFDPTTIPPPNLVLGPLQNHRITIVATLDGPTQLDARVTFHALDGRTVPTIRVVGRRSALFPFVTSWDRNIVETYEWKTNLVETDGWNEYRYQLRKWPRRNIQLGMAAAGEMAGQLRVSLLSAQSKDYGLPLWQYESKVLSDIAAEDQEIMVNTLDSNYLSGGSALIMESHLRFETVTIQEVQADRLVLSPSNLPKQYWKAGATIYPIRVGWLDDEIDFSSISGNALKAAVALTFREKENTFDTLSLPTYLGYPVSNWMPNWIRGRKYTCHRKFEYADGGLFPAARFVKSLRYGETYSFEWYFPNRFEVRKFLSFCNYLAGRHRPAWMPTWSADMQPRSDYVFGSKQLKVAGSATSKLMQANIVEPFHIRMRLIDGREFYDQILSAVPDPASQSNDILNLKNGWGVAATVPWIANICLMPLCRLAEDAVSIEWTTPTMAEALTSFVYVPGQPQ